MEFFICNLVRVVQSPRFYMSLFLTLLCMFLGNLLAFSGIYKIEGLSIFFAASSIRGFSPISLVAALICTLPNYFFFSSLFSPLFIIIRN